MKKKLLIITLLISGSQINANIFHSLGGWATHKLHLGHDVGSASNAVHNASNEANNAINNLGNEIQAYIKKYEPELISIIKDIQIALKIIAAYKEIQDSPENSSIKQALLAATMDIPILEVLSLMPGTSSGGLLTTANTSIQAVSTNVQKMQTIKSKPAAQSLLASAKTLNNITNNMPKL